MIRVDELGNLRVEGLVIIFFINIYLKDDEV